MGFKHSPLPFILDGNFIEDIESGTVGHICEKITASYLPMSELDEANAEFIVTACNSHYELLKSAKHAAATIMAIYDWLDRVDKAGGTGCIEGVASCHAMLTSLRSNKGRLESVVMKPLRAAIARAESTVKAVKREEE